MSSPHTFVGIDIAKEHIDIHVLPTGERLRVRVTEHPDFAPLFELLHRLTTQGYTVNRVVLEASGGYEIPCAAALHDGGWPLCLVNPRLVRDFAKATGRIAKTDRLDAKAIALFAEKILPPLTVFANAKERELRELTARRRQLIDTRVAEENRILAITSESVRSSIKRNVEALEKELGLVEAEITKCFEENAELQKRSEILETAQGIGKVTARALVAQLPELGKLSRGKIASLAGLAPWSNDSGKKSGKRSIWGGRATVRTALYMATLAAVRYNPPIAQMYQRLTKNGKAKKVALIACARKLLTILNSMVKYGKNFNPETSFAA